MIRPLGIVAIALGVAVSLGGRAVAVQIEIINPGGETYPNNAAGNLTTAIEPGGLAPISETGWNSTLTRTAGISGIEAIDANNANGGLIRLSAGATSASTVPAEDFILYQETSHVVSAGDILSLEFFGRGFFEFNDAADVAAGRVDSQTSLFGYVDGPGALVSVDEVAHATTLPNVWTAAVPHVFAVPAGSPLIGENLAIGFFTSTAVNASDPADIETGGFTSVDDVVLTLVPEPSSCALVLAAVLAGAGFSHRGKN